MSLSRSILQDTVIYRFALEYTDGQREQLKNLKDYKAINAYLNKSNVLSQFMNFVSKNGLKYSPNDYSVSKTIIYTQLKANIARNVLDNDGFYPIIKEIDNELLKAIDILNH
jgi:carboxyl-terminal processing protease